MSASLILQIVLSLAIFSFVSTTIKFIDANPFTIGISRLLMASVGVALMISFQHSWKEFRSHSQKEWKSLTKLGFYFFIHWLTYFFSIKTSSASLGILSLSTYGVFMGVMAAVFRGESLSSKDLMASALCLAGVYFLVPEFHLHNSDALGIGLGLVSAFFYALIPLSHKSLVKVPFLIRMFYQFFIAFLAFLFTLPWSQWDLAAKDWWGLIYLGVGATLIAHSLWSNVATRLTGKAAGLIYYSYIPISVLIAVYFLDESLDQQMLIGAALIILGLVLGLVLDRKPRA